MSCDLIREAINARVIGAAHIEGLYHPRSLNTATLVYLHCHDCPIRMHSVSLVKTRLIKLAVVGSGTSRCRIGY